MHCVNFNHTLLLAGENHVTPPCTRFLTQHFRGVKTASELRLFWEIKGFHAAAAALRHLKSHGICCTRTLFHFFLSVDIFNQEHEIQINPRQWSTPASGSLCLGPQHMHTCFTQVCCAHCKPKLCSTRHFAALHKNVQEAACWRAVYNRRVIWVSELGFNVQRQTPNWSRNKSHADSSRTNRPSSSSRSNCCVRSKVPPVSPSLLTLDAPECCICSACFAFTFIFMRGWRRSRRS